MKLKPFFDILITYLLFFMTIIVAISMKVSFSTLMAMSVFLSLVLHRLGLFIHSAAHKEFHDNLEKNDFLYKIYLGWFFGTNLQSHRKVHFAHHKYHGSQTIDPEDSYSNGLEFNTVLKMIFRRDNGSIKLKEDAKGSFASLKSLAIFFHGTILMVCIFCLSLPGGLFYLISVFIGLPFLTHLRNCLEHSPSVGEAYVSRNFYNGFFGFFLGAAGFRMHSEHHKHPKLKYWELDLKAPKVSYIKTFFRILA
jgi:fatty acid desaturase